MEEREWWGVTNLVVCFPSAGTGSDSTADISTALIFFFFNQRKTRRKIYHTGHRWVNC